MKQTSTNNSDTSRVDELKLYTNNIRFYLEKLKKLCRGKDKFFFFKEIYFYLEKIDEIIRKEE